MPIAYSYLRFSTPDQNFGDSERRQIEEAEKWAKGKGLTLDKSFKDKGASGYKGVNRRKGALGKFLMQVHTGEIPWGSYLVVEDLDRLSREHPVDSSKLVNSLLHSGIIIVVLKTGDEYSIDTLRADASGMKMLSLIFELGRASGESERKARLSKSNWDQKVKMAIEEGKVLTAQTPGWIQVVKDSNGVKRFVLDEERVAVVRDIFKWTIGGMGARTVAKELNKVPVPNWGKGGRMAKLWHNSYVQKILQSRAVLGEFQPFEYKWEQDREGRWQVRVPKGDPIKDYYPRIIDDETFLRAKESQKDRKKNYGGNTTNQIGNLLSGLVHARVFDPLLHAKNPKAEFFKKTILVPCLYVNKGKVRETYYVSNVSAENHKRGGGEKLKKQSWAVHAVEYAILKTFEELDWRQIAETASTSFSSEQEQIKTLLKQAEDAKKQCEGVMLAIRSVTTLGLSEDETKKLSNRLLKEYNQTDALRERLIAKVKQLQSELESKLAIADENLSKPLPIPESAYDRKDRDNRIFLRAEIARRVERIELAQAPSQPGKYLVTIVFKNEAKRLISVTLRKNSSPEVANLTLSKDLKILKAGRHEI